MKCLLQLSLLWILFPNFSFSINHYQPGDTLYVWAYHGLNLRATASAKGAKLRSIPYGARVLVLDSVRVKTFSTKEYGGFVMKGHWSKVRFDTLEGWVFDGYLSKYPALRHIKQPDRNFPDPESYPNYGSRVWGLKRYQRLDLEKNQAPTDSMSRRDIYQFSNGAVYELKHGRGDGGWMAELFLLPDFSFEEAYLFFIYNSGFYNYDPTYNPQFAREVEADSSGNLIQQTATSARIRWGLCTYTFEKKGKKMVVKWLCSC